MPAADKLHGVRGARLAPWVKRETGARRQNCATPVLPPQR